MTYKLPHGFMSSFLVPKQTAKRYRHENQVYREARIAERGRKDGRKR